MAKLIQFSKEKALSGTDIGIEVISTKEIIPLCTLELVCLDFIRVYFDGNGGYEDTAKSRAVEKAEERGLPYVMIAAPFREKGGLTTDLIYFTQFYRIKRNLKNHQNCQIPLRDV